MPGVDLMPGVDVPPTRAPARTLRPPGLHVHVWCVRVDYSVRARALAHPFQHGARLKEKGAHFVPAKQSARALCQIGTHGLPTAQHDPSYAAHRACR